MRIQPVRGTHDIYGIDLEKFNIIKKLIKVSANSLGFNPVKMIKKCNECVGGYHLSDNDGFSDTNHSFLEDAWFWKYLKPDLNYYSVEVYGQSIINMKKLSKINYISKGDDYQILFTASKNKRRIIKKISSNYRIKLTLIGSIERFSKKSFIIDDKNKIISLKNKGYVHKF